MRTITTVEGPKEPRRRRNVIAPLRISEIEGGDLQEGQDLEFKRQINFNKPDTKTRLRIVGVDATICRFKLEKDVICRIS